MQSSGEGMGGKIMGVLDGIGQAVQAGAARAGFNVADLINWFVNGDGYKYLFGHASEFGGDDKLKSFLTLVKEKATKYGGHADGVYARRDLPDSSIAGVVDFPFWMYYKLLSYYTTNVYEIPFKVENAFNVEGSKGWHSSGKGIELPDMIKKIPGIGDILDQAFGNIRINYVSYWKASEGGQTSYPELKVSFNLFNDTLSSALINFIFVNTVAPNNMWIQMGILQHSPAIYDVKIDGHARMYACTGDVNVKFKGQLRDPGPAFIGQLVSKHLNRNGLLVEPSQFAVMAMANRLIRIPDVYEVELTFKSMFPLNFNNYLYHYARNNVMDVQYAGGGSWFGGFMSPVAEAVLAHKDDLAKTENSTAFEKYVEDRREKANDAVASAVGFG